MRKNDSRLIRVDAVILDGLKELQEAEGYVGKISNYAETVLKRFSKGLLVDTRLATRYIRTSAKQAVQEEVKARLSDFQAEVTPAAGAAVDGESRKVS